MNEEGNNESNGININNYIRNKFKNIKKFINNNVNNSRDLNKLITDLINNYNKYYQIIIHHLISSIFIRGITNYTLKYLKKIIDSIIENLQTNNICTILLSSTLFFIIEQNYIHNRNKNNNYFSNYIVNKIHTLRRNNIKNNLLSCLGEDANNSLGGQPQAIASSPPQNLIQNQAIASSTALRTPPPPPRPSPRNKAIASTLGPQEIRSLNLNINLT
jgi:hypothetical protein